MITDKNFQRRNGFIWFTGVVEDRNDTIHRSCSGSLYRHSYRGQDRVATRFTVVTMRNAVAQAHLRSRTFLVSC